MLKAVVLCGNPKARSRTLGVAESVMAGLLRDVPFEHGTVDLAEHSDSIFAWPSDEMAKLAETVSGSDLLVVASPTYKAAYTGLLKSFLDRYSNNGLAGVVAIPVMTGASLAHSMAPEAHLRPLLVELGASVPTRSLYFVTDHMDKLDGCVDAWVSENRTALDSLLGRK